MRSLAAQLFGVTRGFLPVLVCSLAAHAVAYRSFVPQDPVHGYFAAYEAAIGGLSALALGALGLVLAALLLGRPGPLRIATCPPSSARSASTRIASLIGLSLAAFFAQEGIERWVASEPAGAVGLYPAASLLAVAAIVLAAVLVVALEHSCVRLIGTLLRRRRALPRAPVRPAFTPRVPRNRRRRNSLADFRGLRAPPVCAA
jgi:hypothetical protein